MTAVDGSAQKDNHAGDVGYRVVGNIEAVSKTAGRIDQMTCLGGPVVRFGPKFAKRIGMMFVGFEGMAVAHPGFGWVAATHYVNVVGNHSRPLNHSVCYCPRKMGPPWNKSIERPLVAYLSEA